MKTQTPNQFFNQSGNISLFEKPTSMMTKKLLSMLLFVLICSNTFAQGKVPAKQTPIVHMDQFLSSLKSTGETAKAKQVERLIKDVQPTAYATAGKVENRGGNVPVGLYIDAKTMNTAGAFNPASVNKSTIELITIKINSAEEMNGGIDLSVFSGFPNLKYIYILAEYVTTEQSIIASVENNNPNYNVFYNILKRN
jgi:hypothetical protein